jgi:hypothetical protein
MHPPFRISPADFTSLFRFPSVDVYVTGPHQGRALLVPVRHSSGKHDRGTKLILLVLLL